MCENGNEEKDLYRRVQTTGGRALQTFGYHLLDPGSLAAWVKATEGSPVGEENIFQMKENLRHLQKENARLKEENEILLKASAFFASKSL